MKSLLARFEALVIANHVLTEELTSVKETLAEECSHSSEVRQERNKLSDENYDLRQDLARAKGQADDYRAAMERLQGKLRVANDKIYAMRAANPTKDWTEVADRLVKSIPYDKITISSFVGTEPFPTFDGKIELIKQHRIECGCCLKEAKDAINAAALRYYNSRPLCVEVEHYAEHHGGYPCGD